jgi:hypothetical protein
MILTKSELFAKRPLPGTQDRRMAARTCSLFCWMAALWFFVSPWAYFGVSDQGSAWNAWIVGAFMVLASLVRVLQPEGTSSFSTVNAVLSIWVLVSPFVFGYAAHTAHLINTLTIGAVTLSCSILSLAVSKDTDTRIGTSDVAVREDPRAASLRRRA